MQTLSVLWVVYSQRRDCCLRRSFIRCSLYITMGRLLHDTSAGGRGCTVCASCPAHQNQGACGHQEDAVPCRPCCRCAPASHISHAHTPKAKWLLLQGTLPSLPSAWRGDMLVQLPVCYPSKQAAPQTSSLAGCGMSGSACRDKCGLRACACKRWVCGCPLVCPQRG